jgi:hypothetical protein
MCASGIGIPNLTLLYYDYYIDSYSIVVIMTQ